MATITPPLFLKRLKNKIILAIKTAYPVISRNTFIAHSDGSDNSITFTKDGTKIFFPMSENPSTAAVSLHISAV